MSKKVHVMGLAIDSRTRKRGAGMRIEAWDPERLEEGPLGTTAANERGAFRFSFDNAWLSEHYGARQMTMRFRAYQNDTLYADQTVELVFNGGEMDLNIDVNFEKPYVAPEAAPAPAPEPTPAPAPVAVAPPPPVNVVVQPPPEVKLPPPPIALAPQLPRALADHVIPELHVARAAGQLVDQASGQPLSGYTLRVLADDGAELAVDVTNADGMFVLVIGDRDPERIAHVQHNKINVRLTSPDGKEAGTVEAVWPDVGAALILTLAASASRGVSPSIVDVGRIANLSLPHGLLRVFVENGVHTLADLRRIGGTQSLGRLPIGQDHPAIRAIEAHAVLSTLSSDLELNAMLIDKGFLSALKVARTPRTDFIAALGDKVGDLRAAQVHAAAEAQVAVVEEIIAGLQAEAALGVPSSLPNVGLPSSLTEGQAASDSRSAHFADLLLVAVQRLRRENGAVSVADLVEMLGQPLDQLLLVGDDERALHESRLAVEAIRRYLGATETPPEYLDQAYSALLSRFGTSPNELRLAMQSRDHRAEIARSLGIASDDEAQLGSLLLRADLPDGHTNGLTEDQLERRFGLRSTTNRPLSDGAVFGDGQDQLRRYHLNGVAWARNTDDDGTIYLRLKRQSGAGARVALFKDRSRTQLVAYGESTGATTTVGLAEQNGSGLSGWIELQFTAESDTIELQPVPQLLAYRLAQFEQQARDEDAAATPEQHDKRAILDPDLIGPDDFRLPYPHNPVFELWRKRRQWIDRQLGELLQLPSLQAMCETMYKQGGASYGSTYPGAPWQETTGLAAFEMLADDLARPLREAPTKARIAHDLELQQDEWERLHELLLTERDRKLDDAERQEGASLLIVAHKRSLGATWREEEHALRVDAQPELFWPSLSEPQANGAWPPVLVAGAPKIDPAVEVDRPDGLFGQRARALAEMRRGEARRRERELERVLRKEGVQGLAREVFGTSEKFAALQQAIADKAADKIAEAQAALSVTADEAESLLALAGPDGKSQWEAQGALVCALDRRRNQHAKWVEEENNLGLDYWQTHKAALPEWRATPSQRAAWLMTLQRGARPSLIDPEAILVDELWQPLSGAAAELLGERRKWLSDRRTDAERIRFQSGSGLAAFDSLVLGSLAAQGKITAQDGARAELKAVRQQLGVEAAIEFGLGVDNRDLDGWKARLGDGALRASTEEQIVNLLYLSVEQFERVLVLRGYTQSGSASAAAGEELDTILSAALTLRSLFLPGDEWADARRSQLGLDAEGAQSLLRLRLAAKHGPLGESEVVELVRVLLTAERSRFGWRWRKEESERGVSVSPLWFRLGEDSDVPPSGVVANPVLRRRWRELLTERTAEHARLYEDQRAIVEAVEEQVLASLYDGIVMRSTIPGGGITRRREWVARNLRLPASLSSEAKASRIDFATRALWSLCQAAQAGELRRDPLNLTVAAGSDALLAAVQSYESWKTQRQERLFPERHAALQSSNESDAFALLAARLDGLNDADDVHTALSEYSESLHDQAAIRVEAAAHALTGRATASQARSQLVLIGREAHGDRRYVATLDTDLPTRLGLSAWRPLPGNGVPGEALGLARRHGELVFVTTTEGDLWLLPYDPSSGEFAAVENVTLPKLYDGITLVEQTEGIRATARRSDGSLVEVIVDGGRASEGKLLVPSPLGRHYRRVAAHVALGERGAIAVLESNAGELHYRWLGSADDGRARPLGAGRFVGITTLGRGVEVWWRKDDLVFRRRVTPGATAPHALTGLSAVSDWLLEATGFDLKSRYVTSGFGAGRPIATLLTSELLNDEQRDLVLGQLTAEAAIDGGSDIGQADQIVNRFLGRGLATLLKSALDGATVELPQRDDAIELVPPLAEQSGAVGAPAVSGVTRRFEIPSLESEAGWVIFERAARSVLLPRRLEGEREQLSEVIPLSLELQPVLEVAGTALTVAPSVGRWDLGSDEPELLSAIGAALLATRDSLPLWQSQAIEEAFVLAPLAAGRVLRRMAEESAADRIEAIARIEDATAAQRSLPRLGDVDVGHAASAGDATLGRPGALRRLVQLQKVERLITAARLHDGAERRQYFTEAAAVLEHVGPRRTGPGARFYTLEIDPPVEWAATASRLLGRLLRLRKTAAVDTIFEEVKAALASDGGWEARLRKLADLVARGEAMDTDNRRVAQLVEESQETIATAHELLLNEPPVSEAARRAAERASAALGRTAAALLHRSSHELGHETTATPWLRGNTKDATRSPRSSVRTDGKVLVADGLRRTTMPIAERLPSGGARHRGLPPQTGVRPVRPALIDALYAEIDAELGYDGSPLAESPSEWLSQTRAELLRLHDEALHARRENGWRATLAELDSDWQRARRNRAAAERFSAWQQAAHHAADLESLEAVQRHFPMIED